MARDALAADRAAPAARRRPRLRVCGARASMRDRRRAGCRRASCHCSSVALRRRAPHGSRRRACSGVIGLAGDLRAIALPALDALEQRAVALRDRTGSRATRRRARRRRCRSAAAASTARPSVVTSTRAKPRRARQGHEIDVAVPLVRVQPAVLAFHEQHAGFGRAVELEQRRVERAADVAPHRARRRLVRQRDELRRRQPHAALQRCARDDREIRRIGFDAARRELAPFAQASARTRRSVQCVGSALSLKNRMPSMLRSAAVWLPKWHVPAPQAGVVSTASRYSARRIAAGDPRVEPHRFALLRVPPRPFPDDLQPVGRRARRREQRDLLGRASRRASPGARARATSENRGAARACRRAAPAPATGRPRSDRPAASDDRGTAAPRPPCGASLRRRAANVLTNSSCARPRNVLSIVASRSRQRREHGNGLRRARVILPPLPTSSAPPLGTP